MNLKTAQMNINDKMKIMHRFFLFESKNYFQCLPFWCLETPDFFSCSNPNTSSSPELREPPKLWQQAGAVRGQGWDEGQVGKELTLGLKVKWVPKISVIKINHVVMQCIKT